LAPAEELVIDAQLFRGEAGMANDFLGPRSGRPAGKANNARTMNAQFEEYEVRLSLPGSPVEDL
jgi:hypothetical protein